MNYKVPNINPEYLFKWEPAKKILFFITQGAHSSGIALKNLENVQPAVLEQLKQMVSISKPSIGDVLSVQDQYVFIVSRKHYSSKHDLDLVKNALSTLEGNYKMSGEDFPDIVRLVRTDFTHIEIKKTSKWEDGRSID